MHDPDAGFRKRSCENREAKTKYRINLKMISL
jgi:hypothetical protein